MGNEHAKNLRALLHAHLDLDHAEELHIADAADYIEEQVTARLDPDMPAQELRLHMGELTDDELRVARAAIRWANTKE